MTVLVLGASVQLATHIRELLPTAEFRIMLCKYATAGCRRLHLRDRDAGSGRLLSIRSGYTAVDAAESESELAWQLNTEAARCCRAAALLDVLATRLYRLCFRWFQSRAVS